MSDSQSNGVYMSPNMCMSMVMLTGTMRRVGGWPGTLANRLTMVVAMVSVSSVPVPSLVPSMFMCMNL